GRAHRRLRSEPSALRPSRPLQCSGIYLMIRLLKAALAAAILVATPAFAHNGVTHLGPLNISLPFTRATLPNAPVGGGYLTIENTGTEADRLVSASSPVASDVQIHEMAM